MKKTDNHSLHIKENKKITKTYRLFINGFDNQNPDFHDILNDLYDAGNEDNLELKIMSPGGLVVECQQIINIIQNKFKNRTTAYIESHASSAGAFTFAAADKRVIYWNSRIMFHNYSGGYAGTYQFMKDRIDFDSEHIIGFLEIARKFFTKKEWKKLIEGKEYWMRAEEMLKRGIATHIIIDGIEYEAKKGLKKLKKFLKKLKKEENKNDSKKEKVKKDSKEM